MRQSDWIDRFGWYVIAGFTITVITLTLCVALSDDASPAQPTVPTDAVRRSAGP